MADKQSIFGRVSQLAKANINAMLDRAEDPEKMLDQMVRDYTNGIAEAEDAVAVTIGNLRLLEADVAQDRQTAADWGGKAAAASAKADQMRASGQTDEADRFDTLAKVALQKQIDLEQQIAAAEPQIASQTAVVDQLKDGLNGMKSRLDELKTKRDELISRAKMAHAQAQVQDAVGSIDLMDPTSELGRFEDKIRREEARVAGQAELASSSLDAQFESLDADADSAEIEARLAALKAGGSTS